MVHETVMTQVSAMILAAGIGSRLEPLTSWKPKALMPLGDRPLLARLALHLREGGIGALVVNAHHHAEAIAKYVHDTRTELGAIGVSHELDLLGTAGGVAQARLLLGVGPTLIWNGDIVAEIDVRGLVRAHEASRSQATLVVKIAEKNAGNVGIDENGKVVRLRQETTAPGEISGGFFLGVHVLGQRLRDALPEVGCLVGDVYLPALRRGERLAVHPHRAEFSDIGTPASYLDANLAWLRMRGERSWIGATAVVESAVQVLSSVVGEGAIVTGAGILEQCVIWPGATLDTNLNAPSPARYFRQVVTPSGTLDLSR